MCEYSKTKDFSSVSDDQLLSKYSVLKGEIEITPDLNSTNSDVLTSNVCDIVSDDTVNIISFMEWWMPKSNILDVKINHNEFTQT